jgi:hypothetical protein
MTATQPRVIWFCDFVTKVRFSYSVTTPKQVQVLHLRRFCEGRDSYRQYCEGGHGFLKLTFGGTELDELDDADYFFKASKYPKTFARSSGPKYPNEFVIVQIRERKPYKLSYQTFEREVLCHTKTPVRFLRQFLSREFLVAADSVTFSVNKQVLQDSDLLSELRTTTIQFTTPAYIVVMVTLQSTTETVLFPRSATVRDFASMVQYQFFFTKSENEPIPLVRVKINGSQLQEMEPLAKPWEPGCAVECETSEVISNRRIGCWVQFESGPVRRLQLFHECSMSFAKYAIARMAWLPFDKFEIFADPQFIQPIDLGQLETVWFRTVSKTLYVKSSRTQLEFSTGKSPFHQELALSDRVFELRLKAADSLRQNFHRIQLFVGKYFVDDDCRVSTLGITAHEQIRVNVLAVGNVLLRFRDLNGITRDYSFPMNEKKTLGDLAALFSPDAPMEVSYEQGNLVKRSTRIEEVICDPEMPIAVMHRVLVLPLKFENEPKLNTQISVTTKTTIDQIIWSVRENHPSIASMVICVGKHEAKKGTKLIKVDPQLEEPIIVAKIFHFGEKLLLIDLAPQFAHPRIWDARYVQLIAVDLSRAQKVRDLPKYLTNRLGLGPIESVSVTLGGRPVDLDNHLSRFDDESKLTINYPPPNFVINYNFVLADHPWVTVFGHKVTLLRIWGHEHTLPAAVAMRFW